MPSTTTYSIRLDEAILDELDRVTRRLKMTKKQFLEDAILAASVAAIGGKIVGKKRSERVKRDRQAKR